MNNLPPEQPRKLSPWVRRVTWMISLFLIFQAGMRCARVPYEPQAGDGDTRTLEALIWMWGGLALGLILFFVGLYLKEIEADEPEE